MEGREIADLRSGCLAPHFVDKCVLFAKQRLVESVPDDEVGQEVANALPLVDCVIHRKQSGVPVC